MTAPTPAAVLSDEEICSAYGNGNAGIVNGCRRVIDMAFSKLVPFAWRIQTSPEHYFTCYAKSQADLWIAKDASKVTVMYAALAKSHAQAVVVEAGGYYVCGHGDVHGPMTKNGQHWLDQHGALYQDNGVQWNHTADSAGNLVRQCQSAPAQPGGDERELFDDLDFEPDEFHAIADMANVGYSLMETIKSAIPDYSWSETPAEIVVHLLNEIHDLKTVASQAPAQSQGAVDERAIIEACAALCEVRGNDKQGYEPEHKYMNWGSLEDARALRSEAGYTWVMAHVKGLQDRPVPNQQEVTEAMIAAGEKLYYSPPDECGDCAEGVRVLLAAIYKAMNAAGPRAYYASNFREFIEGQIRHWPASGHSFTRDQLWNLYKGEPIQDRPVQAEQGEAPFGWFIASPQFNSEDFVRCKDGKPLEWDDESAQIIPLWSKRAPQGATVQPSDVTPKDTVRLSFMDSLCQAYGFENEHHGNRWTIEGPYRTLRDAIDSALKSEAVNRTTVQPTEAQGERRDAETIESVSVRLWNAECALRDRGIRDVKFVFSPGITGCLPTEVKVQAAEFLEAYLAGKYSILEGVGDKSSEAAR